MTFQVELRPAAVRALKQMDHEDRDRIRGAIVLLGEDPRPPGAKALKERPGLRVRIGDHQQCGPYREADTQYNVRLLIRLVPAETSAVAAPAQPGRKPERESDHKRERQRPD